MTTRSRLSRRLIILTGALLGLAMPAAAQAATCTFSAGAVTLAVEDGETATLVSNGVRVRWLLDGDPQGNCGAAFLTDVTDYVVTGTDGDETAEIDFATGGPFGLDAAWSIDLGDGDDSLNLYADGAGTNAILADGGIDLDGTTPAANGTLDAVENVALVGGPGNDALSLAGSAATGAAFSGFGAITGAGGNDTLAGGSADENTIDGDDPADLTATGNDTIAGGVGAELIDPGPGNDVVNAGRGDDTVAQGEASDGADRVIGSFGADTVDYSARTGAVTVNLLLPGSDGELGEGDTIITTETVLTGTGNDVLTGSIESDTLMSGAGNDVIAGLAGDDYLDPGASDEGTAPDTDTVDGGPGADTLVQAGIADAAGAYGSDGADALRGGDGYDGVDYSGRTVNVALSPDGVPNDGAAGEGDNVGADVESFYSGSGNDTINGNGLENDIASGAGNDTVNGLGAADTIAGEDGDDALDGGDGDDTVDGGPGNDTVLGVTGADTLTGGMGTDSVQGGDGDDYLTEIDDLGELGEILVDGTESALSGGAGLDTVDYSLRRLGVVVTLDGLANDGRPGENDNVGGTAKDVENIVGSPWNDTLTGNEQANGITPGTGDDTVAGGDDEDWVAYDDRIENVTVTLDRAANDGQAGEHDNVGPQGDIEDIYTGAGNDTLVGDANGNVLDGGPGNDSLTGGNGDDYTTGGRGNDVSDGGAGEDGEDYTLSDFGVTANLASGTGSSGPGDADQLKNTEDIYGSAWDDTLTGNGEANIITGAAGSDTISGGAGEDDIDAGSGDNSVKGGNGNDQVLGGDGSDEILGGDGADMLSGLAGDDSLRGENGNDSVLGGTGDDALDGGTGNDLITGGAGDDTEKGSTGDDVFDQLAGMDGADILQGGKGIDKADYSSRSIKLTITLNNKKGDGGKGEGDNVKSDVENVDAGSASDKITGSKSRNRIDPGRGKDSVKGMGGDDLIVARDNAKDTIDGGAGSDRATTDSKDTAKSVERRQK